MLEHFSELAGVKASAGTDIRGNPSTARHAFSGRARAGWVVRPRSDSSR